MARPTDFGHRPHADYRGEDPHTTITRGPESLRVTLDTWGPKDFARPMYDALQANWGESPSRTTTEQHGLTRPQLEYMDLCFEGRTLPQVLEGLSFWFTIDGVSRAATHQIVRTRMGAAFIQHGGRDNDWRHRGWTMPETIARACEGNRDGKTMCITDWNPIMRYCAGRDVEQFVGEGDMGLHAAIEEYLDQGKRLYAALVDAGIPWQDARRLLTMGTQTYIHAIYNYQALKGVLANRLEHVMDWEINCVAQLMLRELHMHCPKGLWEHLGSHSDTAGWSVMHEMSSWCPDMKHPLPDGWAASGYAHSPQQNPFWILAPESMEGGEIRWIPTNGIYPQDMGEK
jgi:thymidylate synthase ThyX